MVPVAIIQATSAIRFAAEFGKFTKFLTALSQIDVQTAPYSEAIKISGLQPARTFSAYNWGWTLVYSSLLTSTTLNPPALIYDKSRTNYFPIDCARLDQLSAVPDRQIANLRATYCDNL